MRNSCRYFNGPVHNESCKAGVNYRQLGDDSRAGYFTRLPCVVNSPFVKEPANCEKLSPYTKEELDAKLTEIEKRSVATTKAIAAIRKQKSQSGTVQCPLCEKNITYSVAQSNGHIWACCSTEGCLQWMQ